MTGNQEKAFDLVLVGGGLANGLIAYRLATQRPDLRLLLLESGTRLGGNHTWSFHEGDLTPEENAWFEPFVMHRWPAYDVVFRDFARRVGLGYRSVTSERFHDVISGALGEAVRLGVAVREVGADRVLLDDGHEIRADAVVDGRGFRPSPHVTLAWQKFLGLELRFAAPHGLSVPLLMDATVEQRDGYRFVYVLPFAADRALVEDTSYSDGPELDVNASRVRVEAYVEGRGWRIVETVREECGVLPITMAGDVDAFWRGVGVPLSGLRAGLFHPTTGYSLPDAVRLADVIAARFEPTSSALLASVREWSVARWRGHGFFRLLNRMLFRAGSSDERWRVLRRFYGLPEQSIGRFYAGRLSARDKARLLCGKPPVPLLGAVRAAFDVSARAA